MERRLTNAFPGPPPPPRVPYYHNNNNNYNHQIHHLVAAVGFHQYPQNDNRDQRFNQPQFDNHYPSQQQQVQNMIVDGSSSRSRKRRSLSFTPDPSSGGDGNSMLRLSPRQQLKTFYPPPQENCAGPSCTNPYKYRDSKTKLPLCSLKCYKAVHDQQQTAPPV